MTTKTFYMLCGLPAVGKSTYISDMVDKYLIPSFHVISTDDLFENIAGFYGMTYNEVWALGIYDEVERITHTIAKKAFQTGHSAIFWDQTNLTPRSRQKKLAMVPKDYYKICVCLGVPDDWEERLASRPGKTLPDSVLRNMEKTFVLPNVDEGFDEVRFVNFPRVEI